jgi:hypothetical protein
MGDKDKLSTVEEIRVELSLRFERSNTKSLKNEEREELGEHTLFSSQFKGKCRNCGRIGYKLFQSKNRSSHNGGNDGKSNGGNHCFHCRKPEHVMRNRFKLKMKETLYGHNQAGNNNNDNGNGNRDRKKYDSQGVIFAAASKNDKLTDDICICDRGACGNYFNSSKIQFNVEEIKERITIGNYKIMTATMVGTLKC